MASVTLRRLTKVFDGGVQALHDLDLDVRDGELLVLLGPSGSGKTTVLRCIAGLEEPTSGDVVIGERVVTHDPPATRDVAMVFQTPALYPHLTVRRNTGRDLRASGRRARRPLHRDAGDECAARAGKGAGGRGEGDRGREPHDPHRAVDLRGRAAGRDPAGVCGTLRGRKGRRQRGRAG